VAPSPGQLNHPDAVQEPDLTSGEAYQLPIAKIILRIRSSFEDKAKKFSTYVKDSCIPADAPKIIAIGTMKVIGASRLYPPSGLQALLGYGSPYMVFDRNNPDNKDHGR
jgi:hypothetical protein